MGLFPVFPLTRVEREREGKERVAPKNTFDNAYIFAL